LLTVSIGAPIAAVRIAQGRQETKNKANELEENLYFNRVALAYLDVTANQPARAVKLLDACPERLRGWEWNYVNRRCRTTPQAPIQMTNRLRGVALQGHHLAVVAGEDLQLWEIEPSGKLEFGASIGTIPRNVLAGEPFWVTFSPDGTQLLVVKTNFTVQLWDVVGRVPIRSLVGHTNHVTGAAFHPNGREIATGSYDRTIRFWDAATGRQIKVIDHGEDSPWVYGLAYSPDGKLLAEGSYGRGIIRVWNSQTHEKLFDLGGHLGPTTSLAFSPDSRLLASTSSDDTAVRLWNMSTGKSAGLLEGPVVPNNVAFSPDGSRLVTSLSREVRVWQLAGRREALAISGETNLFVWATFSTDGRQIVSAGEDRTIRIWDASPWDAKRTPRPITLSGHSNLVSAVAFSNDGQRLFSSALDGTGLAWDLSGQVPPTPFQGAFDVSVSADGQLLVSAAVDLDHLKLHVKIFDAISLEEKFSAPGTVEFFSAALSASGDQLVAGSARGDLHFWDWKKSNQAQVTRLFDEPITYVRFSPDGHWLAALGGMGTVKLLDARRLSEPQPERELLRGGVSRDWSRFDFSRDGKLLGLGDDFNDVLVVDVESGHISMRLKGHGGIVHAAAFSTNGRLIASGGDDSTVRLWDAQTGELLSTLLGHQGTVFAVAFSPDSRTLASGSQDRTIKLWRLDGSGLLLDGTPAR
jgi:WD40 repeat protein